jgi:hypothetical protein
MFVITLVVIKVIVCEDETFTTKHAFDRSKFENHKYGDDK